MFELLPPSIIIMHSLAWLETQVWKMLVHCQFSYSFAFGMVTNGLVKELQLPIVVA